MSAGSKNGGGGFECTELNTISSSGYQRRSSLPTADNDEAFAVQSWCSKQRRHSMPTCIPEMDEDLKIDSVASCAGFLTGNAPTLTPSLEQSRNHLREYMAFQK